MKKEITEGKAKVIIDEAQIVSKGLEAFYNPKMRLNRDFTIAIIKAMENENIRIALPLAGTGVRAIRMLKEIPEFVNQIYVNDIDPKAIEYIKENLKINNIETEDEKIEIYNLEGNKFLSEIFGFDYVDIDPFGSPNFLLDSSIRYISRKGMLGISATDTAALAGTYPKTCQRKYFANSVVCPQKHEIGIRILIRKVQLMGLHNEKYLEPVFSYHFEHYYRIFFKVSKSKDKASQAFERLNTYHHHCKKCSYQFTDENKQVICPECKEKIIPTGPMYDGPLNDKKIINKLLRDESIPKEGKIIINRIKEEIPLQEIVGYYDTHNVAYSHKFRSKGMQEIKEELTNKGFKVVTCATNQTAIKTTAPYKEVIKSCKN